MTAKSLAINHERPNRASCVRKCRRIAVAAFLSPFLLSNIVQAESFGQLSEGQKTYVQRICAQVNFSQSAWDYRQCINGAVAALQTPAATSKLTLDYADRLPSIDDSDVDNIAVASTLPLAVEPEIADSIQADNAIVAEAAQELLSSRTAESITGVGEQPAISEPIATATTEAATTALTAIETNNSDTAESNVAELDPSELISGQPESVIAQTEAVEIVRAEPIALEPSTVLPTATQVPPTSTDAESQAIETAKPITDAAIRLVAVNELPDVSAETPSDPLFLEPVSDPQSSPNEIASSAIDPAAAEAPAKENISAQSATDQNVLPTSNSSESTETVVAASTSPAANNPETISTVAPVIADTLASAAESLDSSSELAASQTIALADTSPVIPGSTLVASNTTTTPAVTQPSLAQANPVDPADEEGLGDSADSQPSLDSVLAAIKKFWFGLKETFDNASDINRIIMLAAIALPFCLIAFWLLMRGRKKEAEPDRIPNYAQQNQQQAEYDMDDTSDLTADKISLHKKKYQDQVDFLFGDDTEQPSRFDTGAHDFTQPDDAFDDTDMFREADSAVAMAAASNHIEDEVDEIEDETQDSPTEPEFKSADSWLDKYPEDERLSYAIEFMTYWMAYTDERYEPELREAVFSNPEPDEHDLVKRTVLNKDTAAFAETTSWLQSNTSAEQRVQVINLLMALLVSEEALTPVQNTMLRFLSNAFGITHDELDEQFQTAFGHPLPAMPRPDKPSWWEKQPEDKLKRWDARSVARQSQTIQSRVKLGLSLTGRLKRQDLDASFARAEARCEPENFDQLTFREQHLAERQQAKFQSSRDILLETCS